MWRDAHGAGRSVVFDQLGSLRQTQHDHWALILFGVLTLQRQVVEREPLTNTNVAHPRRGTGNAAPLTCGPTNDLVDLSLQY
jgi:hypothetical protein